MLLHLEDAVKHGHKKVLIHTVDTGVVVLAIAAAIIRTILKYGLLLALEKTLDIFQHKLL